MSRIRSAAARVALALATFGAGGAGLALAAQPAYASTPDNGHCTHYQYIPGVQWTTALACNVTAPSAIANDMVNSQAYPMTLGQSVTVDFTMTNVSNSPVTITGSNGNGVDGSTATDVRLANATLQPGASENGSFLVTYSQNDGFQAMGVGVVVYTGVNAGTAFGFDVTPGAGSTPKKGTGYVSPCTSPANDSAAGLAADGGGGYWIATSTGGVINCGQGVPWYGSPASQTQGHVPSAVVGIAAYGTTGYYVVTAGGNVYNYGNAPWLGSPASAGGPPSPVVGMAATANGYYVVTAAGNVFNFGAAPWSGSLVGHAPAPVVGVATSTGGYLLATADGGVFNFGSAKWSGSPVHEGVTSGVVSISTSGNGYLVTTADNHTYAFGADAGSSYVQANYPTVAVANDPSGGYWTLSQSGAIYSDGGAMYQGGAN